MPVDDARSEGGADGSRQLWLLAGQELLRRGGHRAVKIHALKQEAGLTTGSFYHHFSGVAEYLAELARYWGEEFLEANVTRMDVGDPRQRLANVSWLAVSERIVKLDAAMRDWAGYDDIAAKAVQRTDAVLLEFMATAFEELGFSRSDARLRAQLYLSLGAARILAPWRSELDIDRVLDLLTAPPRR